MKHGGKCNQRDFDDFERKTKDYQSELRGFQRLFTNLLEFSDTIKTYPDHFKDFSKEKRNILNATRSVQSVLKNLEFP